MKKGDIETETELRFLITTISILFIMLRLTIITIICINLRKNKTFITDKNQNDVNVVLKIVTEEQKIEPPDDEIVISVGHGENEVER